MSEKTRVLVVIPTLNEAAHIQAVLAGILADVDSSAALKASVVVVDGGSTDGTCELVEKMAAQRSGLELLHNRAKIQSAAVNLAVRRLGHTADVLIRVDAHADYPEAYCSRLVETLRRVDAHSVVVPMDSHGESGVQLAVALLSNSPLGTGGSAHRAGHTSGFVDHGHHAAFDVEFFRRVGGYDEGFTHNEDAEFDCRQRALGARIYLDSDIRVRYRPRATLYALWRQYFKYGAGRSRTVRRHPSSLRLRQLAVPVHLLLCVVALGMSPVSRWFLLWPAFYVCVLAAFSIKLAIEHRTSAGLLAGRAAFTMHTAWACGFFSGLISHRERIWQREMTVPLPLGEGS